jgi:hypothetical protein
MSRRTFCVARGGPPDQPGMEHMHNMMEILTAEQVERIYAVCDRLGLHRDWVIVPLNAAAEGAEWMQPDGKILLRPPGGDRFESWLSELPDRLGHLELGRAARRGENDPKWPLTGPGEFHATGTRRYLGDRGILR